MSSQGRTWLELGERLAEGSLSEDDKGQLASRGSGFALGALSLTDQTESAQASQHATWAAWYTLDANVISAATVPAHNALMAVGIESFQRGDHPSAYVAEQYAQAALLREVFGNPFRPTSRPSACLAPEIIPLAQAAYAERLQPANMLDQVRLAILADALEDAGCAEAELLGHLRSPGPHVRGCWALDLVLGKS